MSGNWKPRRPAASLPPGRWTGAPVCATSGVEREVGILDPVGTAVSVPSLGGSGGGRTSGRASGVACCDSSDPLPIVFDADPEAEGLDGFVTMNRCRGFRDCRTVPPSSVDDIVSSPLVSGTGGAWCANGDWNGSESAESSWNSRRNDSGGAFVAAVCQSSRNRRNSRASSGWSESMLMRDRTV